MLILRNFKPLKLTDELRWKPRGEYRAHTKPLNIVRVGGPTHGRIQIRVHIKLDGGEQTRQEDQNVFSVSLGLK